MDGKGGCGMSHFDAIRLTIPQALYYLSEGGSKKKPISQERAKQIQEDMSERDVDRIKRELNDRISYFSGRG